jgi:hypothetical protein
VADAVDDKVVDVSRDLREQIRDLKVEVARLTSLLTELRTAQAPVDLPRLPLRSAREVN